MITLAVIAPGSHQALNEEEREAILKEAERLPLYWLKSTYKKSKKISLDCMVQLAQKSTVFFLNQLYGDAGESASGFKTGLEESLTRFIHYLQSSFRDHFDFNSPMPRNLWEPMRATILEALLPGEKCSLQETDEELTALIHDQYRIATEKQIPDFAIGYYWEKLADAFHRSLPVNDATLRTIYTMVSCNFNHAVFVKYVMDHYGKGLPANTDATDLWREHLFQLNRIAEIPGLALEPRLPHCKKMLYTEINNEIQAYVYIKNADKLITATQHLQTNLNIAQLALFYRLQVDANILVANNKSALLHQVAQLYQIPDGNLSHEQLYSKYFKIDPGTIKSVQAYIVAMLNLLRGMGK